MRRFIGFPSYSLPPPFRPRPVLFCHSVYWFSKTMPFTDNITNAHAVHAEWSRRCAFVSQRIQIHFIIDEVAYTKIEIY